MDKIKLRKEEYLNKVLKELHEDINNYRPYKTRKGGATVTVFVPYDCNNNCPFCVNKIEYKDTSNFSKDKIIESIKTIDKITPECDFVFTGGEPFTNLISLKEMIDAIPPTHNIYINTTFPIQRGVSEEEIIDFLHEYKNKISCINISRHIRPFVVESPDEMIIKIPTKVRINTVLYDNYDYDKILGFVDRFLNLNKNYSIQFRYDYTETTIENLYDVKNDKIFKDLSKLFTFKELTGCRMRNSYSFIYKDMQINYHRTLPFSTIIEKDKNDGKIYEILYDILIKQDGTFHSDWDKTPLDLEKYKKVIFEPNDNKKRELIL